jgi:hypothetical protein
MADHERRCRPAEEAEAARSMESLVPQLSPDDPAFLATLRPGDAQRADGTRVRKREGVPQRRMSLREL